MNWESNFHLPKVTIRSLFEFVLLNQSEISIILNFFSFHFYGVTLVRHTVTYSKIKKNSKPSWQNMRNLIFHPAVLFLFIEVSVLWLLSMSADVTDSDGKTNVLYKCNNFKELIKKSIWFAKRTSKCTWNTTMKHKSGSVHPNLKRVPG